VKALYGAAGLPSPVGNLRLILDSGDLFEQTISDHSLENDRINDCHIL